MNKIFILIFGLCFLGAAGMAVAEFSSNTGDQASVEEFGPNGCSKSMEPIDFTLTSFDNAKTYFKVPAAYLFLFNQQSKGGEVSSIHLSILLKDFSPACLSNAYTYAHNTNDNKSDINLILSITDGIPSTPTSNWGGRYKKENPDYIKIDELGFKVYQNTKAIEKLERKNLSRFDELLIPPANMFEKPTVVICYQAYDQDQHDFKYTTCRVRQHYAPHLNLDYSFRHTQLHNISKIDKNVDAFLKKIILGAPAEEELKK